MEQLAKNMTDLTGKRALVTGASRGIGRAVALAFKEAGAHVIACARASDDLQSLEKALGTQGTIWAGDATKPAFLTFIESLEAIDILVNNLGTNHPQPLLDVTDETLELMIDMNIRANVKITRSVLAAMPEGGSIVTITSQMGHIGSPNRTIYCLCKHALEGFTKALAIELAPRNIRVNAVAPTFIETPMTKPMFEDEKFKQFVENMIPLGRIGHVSDVAAAVLYLSSPAANMVTGHSLLIDGGWTAQ